MEPRAFKVQFTNSNPNLWLRAVRSAVVPLWKFSQWEFLTKSLVNRWWLGSQIIGCLLSNVNSTYFNRLPTRIIRCSSRNGFNTRRLSLFNAFLTFSCWCPWEILVFAFLAPSSQPLPWFLQPWVLLCFVCLGNRHICLNLKQHAVIRINFWNWVYMFARQQDGLTKFAQLFNLSSGTSACSFASSLTSHCPTPKHGGSDPDNLG